MKTNLLKKALLSTSLILALTGCDESDGSFVGYDDNLQQVTVDGDYIITVSEHDGVLTPAVVEGELDSRILEFHLQNGVTNPEDTVIYSGQFTFHRLQLDDAGKPIFDENNETIPLYEGPSLPSATVSKSGEVMYVDLGQLNNLLVHPDTVAENGGEGVKGQYSYGKYRFTYELNNGADEAVERTIWLTVNGAEDVLTDIDFDHPTGLIANPGFEAQVFANPVPSNATYHDFTYSITPESVATIDASTGIITGVELGQFTVTATSTTYPEIMSEIQGEVVPLEYPIGISLRIDGNSTNNTALSAGQSVQLEAVRLPEGEDFVNPGTITWESMDTDRVTVDENGMITSINYDSLTDNNSNFVDIIATVPGLNGPVTKTITVEVTEHETDFLAVNNSAVELGHMATDITKYWQNKVDIIDSEEAAKDGNYGIHVVSDGTAQAGLTVNANAFNQIVGQGQGRRFKVSYDLKVNTFDTEGNPQVRLLMVSSGPGTWPSRIENYSYPATNSDWTHVEFEFDESDWTTLTNPGAFSIIFRPGPVVDAYIDNLSLTIVE